MPAERALLTRRGRVIAGRAISLAVITGLSIRMGFLLDSLGKSQPSQLPPAATAGLSPNTVVGNFPHYFERGAIKIAAPNGTLVVDGTPTTVDVVTNGNKGTTVAEQLYPGHLEARAGDTTHEVPVYLTLAAELEQLNAQGTQEIPVFSAQELMTGGPWGNTVPALIVDLPTSQPQTQKQAA